MNWLEMLCFDLQVMEASTGFKCKNLVTVIMADAIRRTSWLATFVNVAIHSTGNLSGFMLLFFFVLRFGVLKICFISSMGASYHCLPLNMKTTSYLLDDQISNIHNYFWQYCNRTWFVIWLGYACKTLNPES